MDIEVVVILNKVLNLHFLRYLDVDSGPRESGLRLVVSEFSSWLEIAHEFFLFLVLVVEHH